MAIDFQGLIGNNLKNYTQNILDDQSSEVLTFYIDNSNGYHKILKVLTPPVK